MDIEELFKIMDCLKEYPYDDIDIETEGLKLHLRKHDNIVQQSDSVIVDSELTTINSPMVGIIHLSDSIQVGTKVQAGTVVAQIESMKLFNDIKAPKTGVVTDILVSNNDGVEFEQPLLMISEE